MHITLDHIEDVAAGIKTFWFKPERKVNYIAGQFIEMYLPHKNADERGQKHWFTLSSSPTEKLLSITTKHFISNGSTFKQQLFMIEPGSEVIVSEPMGDFVLPMDLTIPLVFIAGGIGITPVRSIIKWLTDIKERRQIHIIYSARSQNALAYLELLRAYDMTLDIVLSQPEPEWSGAIGHLSGKTIIEMIEHNNKQLLYISGPELMTEKLESELLAAGLNKNRLVLDFFPGYLHV